ncbi:MAG: hypothetical protein ABL949_03345 [Fimbriimonadaceae bacterium]
MIATSRFTLVSVALLTVGLASAQNTFPKPGGFSSRSASIASLLFKSLGGSRSLNVEGIVLKRNSRASDPIQLKLEQSSSGATKLTVLAPLCDQGIVNYEDGKIWKTYIPSEKRLELMSAPNRDSNLDFRRDLSSRNYRFSSEPGEPIAGRKTIIIYANPRNPEMPSRRYSLDAAKQYLLRVETEFDGERKVLHDTVAISFPTSNNVTDIEKEIVQNVRRVEKSPPISWSEPKAVQNLVGFKPTIPANLPCGFEVIDRQLAGDRAKFVAIRISDGLANATVYQISAKSQFGTTESSGRSSNNRREANGIRFRLSGDLPDSVTKRILDFFVREAIKGLNPLPGTDWPAFALNCSQISDDCILIVIQSI